MSKVDGVVRAGDVMRNATVTIKITGLRRWWMRVRLGLLLIRFGIRIMGSQCVVVDSEVPA